MNGASRIPDLLLFFSGARFWHSTFLTAWSRAAEKQKHEMVGVGVL
jgi:hypothetical protein